MSKWNMIIDVAECTNCQLCALATMDEYVGNAFPATPRRCRKHGHRWIDILQKERGQVPMIDIAYVPTMCNHCDDAPCIKAAKDGAITKREDGIVIIDPVKAKGQKQLVDACPYGHIWWNEELQVCRSTGRSTRICIDQGWQQTRGHQSCPTGAMRAIKIDDDEMARIARDEGLEPMKPELGTRPRVYYRNLWRYTKCFIGGTVSARSGRRRRLRRRRARAPDPRRRGDRGDRRPTITATSNSTGSTKSPAPTRSRSRRRATRRRSVEARLGASLSLGEIRLA